MTVLGIIQRRFLDARERDVLRKTVLSSCERSQRLDSSDLSPFESSALIHKIIGTANSANGQVMNHRRG